MADPRGARVDPEVIFLAEAFTRPAMMTTLAKVGFAQTLHVLHLEEHEGGARGVHASSSLAWSQFYRPNLFANTPDILHEYLQLGGPPAFEARLVLAATLSPTYGIYSGLRVVRERAGARRARRSTSTRRSTRCKKRTLDGPLLPLVQRLNEIRRAEPALQRVDNLRWLETENDQLVAYVKDDVDRASSTSTRSPSARASCVVPVALGFPPAFEARELLTGDDVHVARRPQLRPARRPAAAHVLKVARLSEPGHWFERDPLWFKTAVFYEIHMRGFFDGNDDGSGDFRGLTEKLDYLQWLGIDCIWLLPFYPSPLRDGGYDIADFFDIHPDYGDDRRLHATSSSRRTSAGMRVIADLVMNHTSTDHPWFQESRTDPTGPYGDWYVWGDDDHALERGAHHLRRHRAVELDVGPGARPVLLASLLRAPAGPELRQPRGAGADARTSCASGSTSGSTASASTPCRTSTSATARTARTCRRRTQFLKRVRAEVDARYPDRVLLAEANQWPEDVVEYFGDGDECHMAFHFPRHAAHVHGACAARTRRRSSRSSSRRRRSRTARSGGSSCATTTS